jgi:two-component system, chemotaxis family, chemotaxis protein CheY
MKILIVDDEQDVQSLFEQRFRKEVRNGEFELVFAHSGTEALNFLQNHSLESILILSDINMPGMTGLELLKTIKEIYESPPPIVMMITAYGDDANYQKAIGLGADDFITKPLDFTSLKDKLKTLMV